MAICPNEHVHFLLLALRDQDREWVLVLLAELLASLVVPGNPLPQLPSFRVTDEGLILADRLLREGATRRRVQALDVPSIAGESARQAAALDQVADALAGMSHLATIVLAD